MDLLGVARPVYWAESLYNLQPTLQGWSDGGAPASSPMPKSTSFLLKGKNSTIDSVMIAYLFVVECVGIYKEKLWLLSLLDSDTISVPLGEEFPFPYHGPTVKGLWRIRDHVRFFFPNPWGADHGDWAFSLLHEFLDCLYRLIT